MCPRGRVDRTLQPFDRYGHSGRRERLRRRRMTGWALTSRDRRVATSQRHAHVPWNPSKRKWSARAGGTQRATLFSLGASLIRATSGRWLAPSDARGRNPARTEPNCGHQREGVGFEPTEPLDGGLRFQARGLGPEIPLSRSQRLPPRTAGSRPRRYRVGSARTLWLSAGTDSKAAATERLATGSSSGPLARWRSR